MIVGYLADSYPYNKNIVGVVKNIKYKKVLDCYSVLSYLARRLNLRNKNKIIDMFVWDNNYKYNDIDLNKVDILHFMNTISFGKTPWITTYETVVPSFSEALDCHYGANPDFSILRENRKIERALNALAGAPCKKIIAMSECALGMQKDLLLNFPEYEKDIEKKLLTIHSPQTLFVNDFIDKKISIDETIRFLFVGRSFFRKGGLEMLHAFKHIKDQYNYDLKLTIISSFQNDSYVRHEGIEEFNKAIKIIYQNPNWIESYTNIKNSRLIELMKRSHVSLLPTWSDTYGFNVLECQAAGCPVISTDVRALPEINNEKIGWVIHVPKNRLGEAIFTTIDERELMKQTIEQGLEQIIIKIFSDRTNIIKKSNESIAHIKENHSPDHYANDIRAIYNE